ncbi:MAG: polyprenyl synthetase family protein [Pyrinomonadaceae bacterium]
MMKPSFEPVNLADYLAGAAAEVDRTLERLVPSPTDAPQVLHQAIRWSLFAGGKRLRPALTIAVGEAFGAARESLLATAAALEMLHTYSLIHDDLPAMDDDDLRRGRATCHIQFDEATAILAGDALQSLAFQTIAQDPLLDVDTRLRLIARIAGAIGTPDGMVAGQALDLAAEAALVDSVGLAVIHHKKTGALINAAACAGVVIAGAARSEVEQVAEYAAHLGLLFQITDDLLDVTASADDLGKTPGKDERAQKATYVSLFGLERARAMAAAEYEAAGHVLDQMNCETGLLRSIAEHFHTRRT